VEVLAGLAARHPVEPRIFGLAATGPCQCPAPEFAAVRSRLRQWALRLPRRSASAPGSSEKGSGSRWLDRLTFLCLALGLFLAGGAAADTGVATAEDLLLGMSTALSGPAADLGRSVRDGVLVGLDRQNRAGGVGGRKLHLVVLDDGYEPTRTAPNMRRLIGQERVLAVIGNVGTPTAIAAVPIANEQRTLLFAPYTGAGLLRRSPPDRYVINFRASYAEEINAMVDALVDIGGLQPAEIAFFTQRDSYGDAGYVTGVKALKRHGLTDEQQVLNVQYERNTVAVENALADMLLTDPLPRAVIMVGTYASSARFIRLAQASGLRALYLNVSFVGGTPLGAALGDTRASVIVTQVVPDPLDTGLPIVRDYHRDLRAAQPRGVPTFAGLEGYIAARILTLALHSLDRAPDRESLVDALEGLSRFDLGLGVPLRLAPEEHQASHEVWPTVLSAGVFAPFQWEDLPLLLERTGTP